MPYKLTFKDITSYWEECHYCGKQKCGDCPVPFDNETTVQKILDKLNLLPDSFFTDDYMTRGKELQLKVVWHQSINKGLFYFLNTANQMKETKEESDQSSSTQITLTDCLQEFK